MRHSIAFFPCTILIALFGGGPVSSAAGGTVRTYSNVEHNYRLTYPASWHISVVSMKAGPVLYNYDPSFAMGQGLFPPGGAEIFVLPPADIDSEDRSRSPQELAGENVRRFSYGNASLEQISNPGNPAISDVIRVSYDYQRIDGEDLQRDVIFYFRFNGKPFKLLLNYWKGDPKAASYEQTLFSILKSIRPVTTKSN